MTRRFPRAPGFTPSPKPQASQGYRKRIKRDSAELIVRLFNPDRLWWPAGPCKTSGLYYKVLSRRQIKINARSAGNFLQIVRQMRGNELTTAVTEELWDALYLIGSCRRELAAHSHLAVDENP